MKRCLQKKAGLSLSIIKSILTKSNDIDVGIILKYQKHLSCVYQTFIVKSCWIGMILKVSFSKIFSK